MSRPEIKRGLRPDIAEKMDRMAAYAQAAVEEMRARRVDPAPRLAAATCAAIHALRAHARIAGPLPADDTRIAAVHAAGLIPGNFRRKAISASQAPAVAERGVLEARREELQAALRQGGKAHQPAAAQLVFVFPAYGADEISDAATIERLVSTLSSFPVWAVAEAVQRFRHSRAVTPWDRGRCPTEPQIVAEVRTIMAPVETELHRVSSILDAEILPEPTEADRAKVARLAEDLARSMRFPCAAVSEQELARVTEGGMGGLKLDRRILSKAGVPSEAA